MKRLLTRLTIFPILSSIVLMLLLAACHDPHTSAVLARADQVMEEHPDSAYSMLQSIDSTRLRRADAPLYAVLDAQARHKLNLEPPTDSLLNIAVDRYTSHGPDSLLMKALFYRAAGKYQTNQLPKAVVDATRSWEIAESANNDYWMAKSAELLADLFYNSFNFKDESQWRSKAAEHYKAASRMANYMCSLCDLAASYTNYHDPNRCRVILDSIKRESARHQYPQQVLNCNIPNEVYYHINFSNPEKVDSILSISEIEEILSEQPSLYLAKARRLMENGKYSESRTLLDSISELPNFENEGTLLLQAYYDLAKLAHDSDKLSLYTDSLLKMQLADLNQAISQPVTTAQRDYFLSASKVHEQRNRITRRNSLLAITFVITLLIISGITYKLRLRKKERQLIDQVQAILVMSNVLQEEVKNAREAQAETAELKSKLTAADARYASVNQELQETSALLPEIYKDRWKVLDALCKSTRNMKDLPPATVVKDIAKVLEQFRGKSFIKEMEKELNRDFDHIIEKLRTQCPSLQKNDIPVCILTFAGLSTHSIAMILGMTLELVHVKRGRIRERLRRDNPEDLSLFLRKFDS